MAAKTKEPLLKFKLKEILTMPDIYTLAMLAIYSFLALIFYPYVESASRQLLMNSAIAIGMISIATIAAKYNGGHLFFLFRRLYVVPVIYLIYSQVHYYIPVINSSDYDSILIIWDRALFGGNPTEWMQRLASPILTEYLQSTYMMFFFFPIFLGVEIHFRGQPGDFNKFARTIMFGFYLSYLLYFFMPAIGPRFTIHEFQSVSYELPGLLVTNIFRGFVDAGGGIIAGAANPALAANRDCMPSGHTMLTIINMILAFRFRSKFRWGFLILGLSLIFSTVYLRYHYVVDLIAGLIFALIAVWIEPKVRGFFKNRGFSQA